MSSLFKSVLEHGPRQASARLRSLARPARPDGHVLMIHTGRSGSTVLGQMLDQHPCIFWDGEVLEKRFHAMGRERGVGIMHLYGKMTLDKTASLVSKRLRSRSGGRIFGIEIQDYQLAMIGADCESFLNEMRALGFTRFVILERNPIRKLVSHVAATQRGQHHAQLNEKVKDQKVSINCDRLYYGHTFTTLEDVLEGSDAFFAAFYALLAHDHVLRLSYETHLEDTPVVAYEAVCRYLELEPQRPQITLKKTTTRNLADLVENYAEVEARLLKTSFREAMEQVAKGDA